MLTEERQKGILQLLDEKGSVTLQELKEMFSASESTIRRDLNVLHKKGALTKVFGGAVKNEEPHISVREEQVALREEQNRSEKIQIAKFAAALIEPEDFVYLDAGTTTGYMIPFLTEKSAKFVTNAASHALRLAESGFSVVLIGGEVKAATEAIVGNEAYVNLQKYNFTKGFFGSNGVDQRFGFTTPDVSEALVKECAVRHSRDRYVLCDSSKFYQVTPVTFCEFNAARIITDRVPDETYRKVPNIIVAPSA